jgi:hypothetical protein
MPSLTRLSRNKAFKEKVAEFSKKRNQRLAEGSYLMTKNSTLLVSELSLKRFPRVLTQTLSTHGNGVQVERAPGLGFALKATKHFMKGSFITQYEG